MRNGKGQEAATAPSIGTGHIGRRRSPPGEEESHPQSQAGASGEDKGQADGDWHSGFGPYEKIFQDLPRFVPNSCVISVPFFVEHY